MPWPKGVPKSAEMRAKMSAAHKGVPHSAEHTAKVAAAQRGVPRPQVAGEQHGRWLGDAVGYKSLHMWVYSQGGRAAEHLCVACLGPAREWANVSGTYRRDMDDFVPLCSTCHGWYDRAPEVAERPF